MSLVSQNRFRVQELLGARHVPLILAVAFEQILTIDPERRVFVSPDNAVVIRIRAWFDHDDDDAKIVALLIAAGFTPTGMGTMVSGEWTWDGSVCDTRLQSLVDFISVDLHRRGIRIRDELSELIHNPAETNERPGP